MSQVRLKANFRLKVVLPDLLELLRKEELLVTNTLSRWFPKKCLATFAYVTVYFKSFADLFGSAMCNTCLRHLLSSHMLKYHPDRGVYTISGN